MFQLEQGDRSRIEDIKNNEREKVQKDLLAWKEIKRRENEKQMIENAQKSASYDVKIENKIKEENSTKMTELEDKSFKTTDNKIIFNNVCNQNLTSGKFFNNIFCVNTYVALFKILLYLKITINIIYSS